MADETTKTGTETGTTQETTDTSTAEKTEGQTTSTETATDTKNAGDTGDKTFTQTELNDILTKRLAKEKSKWEKDKDLPEIERLKKEREELATKVREREIGDEFSTGAEKAGAKNVARLLKFYRSELEISDDGKIENLKEILDAAKTDFPEFFASANKGSGDGGAGKGEKQPTIDEQVDAEFAKTGRKHAFRL